MKILLQLVRKALPFLRPKERQVKFKLRDASVGGRGLHPEFRDANWETIRDAIYEPRVTKP